MSVDIARSTSSARVGSPPGDPTARSNDVAAPSADATRTSSGSP